MSNIHIVNMFQMRILGYLCIGFRAWKTRKT
nr:MAG TPA: hypothetical protein [Caudoviricetes sp.]DAN11840.1 MAG TPA: hypothetical protein [Caudoviricetes sp.]